MFLRAFALPLMLASACALGAREAPAASAPAALETIDGFDMGDFLCCGAREDRPSPSPAPSVVEASSSSSLGPSRKAEVRGESGPSPTSAIASMLFGAPSRQ